MKKENTLDLISNTPLVYLDRIYSGKGKIYGKLEYLQPGGSVKDRAALQIIKDAYHSNRLKKGQYVVEMTSGNMGAGLAVVCRQFGNPLVLVISKGNSPERLKILKALGAEIVLTEQVDGQPGKVTGKDIEFAANVAKEIAREKGAFYVDQLHSMSGIKAHFETTGPEIWNDLGSVSVFIASLGSGATFIGTSKYLKSKNQSIKCIAVEPETASFLKTGVVTNPKHIIQGTGYGFLPTGWDAEIVDDIITVTDREVEDMTKRLASEQSLYVGYSSGANVMAALKYLETSASAENVVTILCDSGYKYTNI